MAIVGSDVSRVLVVDDHPGIRAFLASLIDSERPRLHAVGSASSALEALRRAAELRPDIVLLDADLGGDDGLALIPSLCRLAACRVIVLTSLADPQVGERARRLGASGCLHKSAPAERLLRQLMDGADDPMRSSAGGTDSREERCHGSTGASAHVDRSGSPM